LSIKFKGRVYKTKVIGDQLFLKLVARRITDITELDGLENLEQLDGLDLSRNNINEIRGLNLLFNLKTLKLNKNQLTSIKGLDYLSNLEVLELRGNNIREIENLDELSNLKILNLARNQIYEIKNLDNLKNLKELYLEKNSIIEIKGLEKLKKLKKLVLSNNNIKKIKGLEHLENLECLVLDENQISEIKGLENLENLRELYLNRNPIEEIKGLKKLSKLRVLELKSTKINEIKGIEHLNNLEIFNLKKSPVYNWARIRMGGVKPLGAFKHIDLIIDYLKGGKMPSEVIRAQRAARIEERKGSIAKRMGASLQKIKQLSGTETNQGLQKKKKKSILGKVLKGALSFTADIGGFGDTIKDIREKTKPLKKTGITGALSRKIASMAQKAADKIDYESLINKEYEEKNIDKLIEENLKKYNFKEAKFTKPLHVEAEDVVKTLKHLKELVKEDIISKEEFEQKKRDLLKRL